MTNKKLQRHLQRMGKQLSGQLFYDSTMRKLYATDASVYRELPLAVVYPKDEADIQRLIQFAINTGTSLIPRAAGTSLAGQCVGKGIVVDISKYFHQILEINTEERWVRVQPGIVRDDLNKHLAQHNLFFAPETSTANRAMLGGMVGNNSCGANSIVYGTTREHTLALKAILSDGSIAKFQALSRQEFRRKGIGNTLESQIYRHIGQRLFHPQTQKEIKAAFPHPSIHRRNTGYAVDMLLQSNAFTRGGADINLCQLLCGSEGTLAFTTELTLNVVPLPPKEKVLLCVHFTAIPKALEAVVIAKKHPALAIELLDKIVLDCTKANVAQQKNRFFINGDPQAILLIEFAANTLDEAQQQANNLMIALSNANLGYDFPVITGSNIKKVWTLRKEGLGLLANIKGDAKPVAVVEDTAVRVEDLPAYISEFADLMESFNQQSVYYAHAGAGELHLRPILNLKDSEHVQMFHDIGEASAKLVKKYNGSLSGEHGDGRVRAEFIPLMVGEKVYQLFREIKQTWDPNNIFNPGKIVDAPPMNESLRYQSNQVTPRFSTMFDYSATDGILRLAEQCNGTGACRKTHLTGGTMCPSYMATRNEKDTTRARANILREVLTANNQERQTNPFNSEEIKEVMDLCLSCKGCQSECPSNVDVAMMKAEFLHQYYQSNPIPFRAKVFANIARLNGLAAILPRVSNFFLSSQLTAPLIKKVLGVAPVRSMPILHKTTLWRWFRKWKKKNNGSNKAANYKGSVYLFNDEFTNYNDTHIGIATITLLSRLGYEVNMPKHEESGRAAMSKGLLDKAKQHAEANVRTFTNLVNETTPLLGIEPSAILSFRDEYPKLLRGDLQQQAQQLATHTYTIEEFLWKEAEAGRIVPEQFTQEAQQVLLHGHCHQKAISSVDYGAWVLGIPKNYDVSVIPSGCCGMAGSFGYEAEHYQLSMQVGELVLFPTVNQANVNTIIAASGTSCRHQIADGTKRQALHPVEILLNALV